MITVHRDDVTDTMAQIIFHKMKPRSVGNTGSIELHFDLKTLTYYQLEGIKDNQYVKKYAKGKEEIINTKPLSDFQGLDFDDDLLF